MSTSKEITDAAHDILARVRELDNPKDAICAILIAHVKLSLDHAEDGASCDVIINRYAAAFKDSYEG